MLDFDGTGHRRLIVGWLTAAAAAQSQSSSSTMIPTLGRGNLCFPTKIHLKKESLKVGAITYNAADSEHMQRKKTGMMWGVYT